MPSLGSTPGGDSILITSAPKSANCLTQVGPARTLERSRIRKRASAVEAEILAMVWHDSKSEPPGIWRGTGCSTANHDQQGDFSMKKVLLIAAEEVRASCASYQDNAPSWLPGSGAVSVKLSGADEVPPLSAAGSGSGSIRVNSDGTVSGSVTTTGVEGTMAHIHQGAKGQNGPVIIPLTKAGDAYNVRAGAKLNDAQIKAFKEGGLYVNVHTATNKGGSDSS